MNAFCVCSSLLTDEALRTLQKRFPVILLPPDNALPPPIRCHPDSIFAVVGDDLIVPAAYYDAYPDVADEIASRGQFRLILSDAPRGPVYPADTGLNAAVGRDFVICRPKSAAPELLQAAERNGYDIIPVRQGYGGCACLVTDGGVLTGDPGIAKALKARGIPHQLLSPEGIRLPGYDCGFIGGACGFHDGTIFINGDPSRLPCYPLLRQFAMARDYSIHPLSAGDVTDVGGIRIFSR